MKRPTPLFIVSLVLITGMLAWTGLALFRGHIAEQSMPAGTLYFPSAGCVGQGWGKAARTPDDRWWFRKPLSKQFQEVKP